MQSYKKSESLETRFRLLQDTLQATRKQFKAMKYYSSF